MPSEVLGFRAPETTCTDKNCPFHGSLSVKGPVRKGVVVSTKMQKTATVVVEYYVYIPKYERYMKKRKKLHVRVPPCLQVKEGDIVYFARCRRLAKTVAHVVLGVEHRGETG
ncbi:MAG: 30S ribosomal protein S17 [bacterium]|nr:30S ribosomal protein S17 [bacterium]